jgi:hypothetical protein
MDNFLARRIGMATPPFNPVIANGIGQEHGKHCAKYIDDILRDVSKNFPPEFTYLGSEKCTAIEQFHFESAKKNSERYIDIAPNSLVLMKYNFAFNGQSLPPYFLYLPHIGEAGTMFLSGTRYLVTPMLSDVAFSPGEKGVFKRLLRDKLNFERTQYHIRINDELTTVQLAHSMFYHKTAKMRKSRPSLTADCTLAHYLFCKCGVKETFKRFGGTEVVVGREDTVNTDNYPKDKFVIVSSRGIKPVGLGKIRYVTTNSLRVAIPVEKFDTMNKALAAGFIYVVDHFPERMAPGWENDKGLWMRLLGLILFSASIPEGKIYEDIREHIRSLDEYIDSIVAIKLRESGFECRDIYELIAIVIRNIDQWIYSAHNNMNSMYDKELTVLYNILYVVTFAIFNMHYKLKAAARKGLKPNDVLKIMQKHFRPKLIHGVTKGNSCISMDSYSGDNKILSITTKLVPQKNHVRSGQRERAPARDGRMRMHVSVAEIGGFTNMPKSEPSGRSCINMHARLSPKWKVMRDPNKIELLDRVQSMLSAPII